MRNVRCTTPRGSLCEQSVCQPSMKGPRSQGSERKCVAVDGATWAGTRMVHNVRGSGFDQEAAFSRTEGSSIALWTMGGALQVGECRATGARAVQCLLVH